MIAEVVGDAIVLRPLRPLVVDVDPKTVERLVRESKMEWEEKLDRTLEEVGS